MKTYTCRGCNATVQNAQLSGYDVAKETGWSLILTLGADVHFIWLCPICAERAATLASEAAKILKTDNVYFGAVTRCGNIDEEYAKHLAKFEDPRL